MARHGTRSNYATGCRCRPCRIANRQYIREWNRRNNNIDPEKYQKDTEEEDNEQIVLDIALSEES